jgi:DNA-binding transcriptional LysR family regulator
MRGTRFAELNAFVAVADFGSFTKAAAGHVHKLGEPKRPRTRGEAWRPAAKPHNPQRRANTGSEQMLKRLRPLFEDLESAVDEANAFRDKPAGRLRLTVSPPVASFVLAPLLPRFFAQYPQIVIDMSVDPVLTDIITGRYDAGIRIGRLVARDMIAVRIAEPLHLVVVASLGYLAEHWRVLQTFRPSPCDRYLAG